MVGSWVLREGGTQWGQVTVSGGDGKCPVKSRDLCDMPSFPCLHFSRKLSVPGPLNLSPGAALWELESQVQQPSGVSDELQSCEPRALPA